jgi:hypothetical protein
MLEWRMNWLSLHIFHANPNGLLHGSLITALDAMKSDGILSGYFIVRYWNGGPHLRLRLKQVDPAQAESIRDKIAGIIVSEYSELERDWPEPASYLAHAERMASLEQNLGVPLSMVEKVEPLQQHGSVQIRPYRFDAARYGLDNQEITETHFCNSTTIALLILRMTKGSPNAINTLALHLAAATVRVMRRPKLECAALLMVAAHGMFLVASPDGQPVDITDTPPEELLFHLDQGSPLPDQPDWVNELLSLWTEDLIRCSLQLQLNLDHDSILLDYTHMLNNRLGLGAARENYFYHLIGQALQR